MDTWVWVPDDVLARAVGAEIRRLRDEEGLTRKEVIERLPYDMSNQTLFTYEDGSRHCTVVRYVHLMLAMGGEPAERLRLALQRAEIELESLGLVVDLHAVLDDEEAGFEPLQEWARKRLANEPETNGVVRLSRAVIQEMAIIFDFSKSALVNYLANFAPRSASS